MPVKSCSGFQDEDSCFNEPNCEWIDDVCISNNNNNNNNKNNNNNNNNNNKERFGNILSGFEFNDSCMIITIIFIIIFMYKEEIMKSTIIKKLLK